VLNNTEFAKKLIHRGVDVNIRDRNGKTVLMYALKNINFELVKILIKRGANV